MYKLALKLDHWLPFSNVSKEFPDVLIYRWCNREVDIIEAEHPNGKKIDDFEGELKNTLKKLMANLIYIHRYSPNSLEAVIKCKCATSNSSIAIIEASNCVPVMPISYNLGLEHVKLYAFNSRDQRNVIKNLETVSKVFVEEKGQSKFHSATPAMTVSIQDFFGKMTNKQLYALISAIEMGYYEIPKRTTIDEIASRLGTSRSTLEEHLRKAEVKVMKIIRPYARIAYLTSKNRTDS